jgi:altronate dehydratase large subunit
VGPTHGARARHAGDTLPRVSDSGSWEGYHRPDGTVGARNHVLVVPGGLVPTRIAEWVPGVITVTTSDRGFGRTTRDRETIARTLVGLGRNPNVHAAVVWGSDASGDYPELAPDALAEGIAAGGRRVEVVDAGPSGSSFAGLEAGVRAARALVREASRERRRPAGLADLALGVKCGNSDTTSGAAGNPVVGYAFDRVVAAGGRALFGETTEILGAEDELAARAQTPAAAEALLAAAGRQSARAATIDEAIGDVNPIPANRAGGIASLEQKSRGAIRKSGEGPLAGVLRYGEPPPSPGLWFVDSWMGSLSLPLGLCASGANVTLYQLGAAFSDLLDRTSSLVAPLVWTSANRATRDRLGDDLDFYSGGVLDEGEPVSEVGERLLAHLCDVASGTLSAAETLAYTDPQQIYLLDPPL